jgi:hypothetical protein
MDDLIVTFRDQLDEALLGELGIEVRHLWPSIRAAAVRATPEQRQRLAEDRRVERIEPDAEMLAF